VGGYQLDNTHELRDEVPFGRLPDLMGPATLPLEDDADAIKSVLWLHTDRKYKTAADQLVKVRTNQAVTVDEEDDSADFSREEPEVAIGQLASLAFDGESWQERLKEYSTLLDRHPEIHESHATLTATATNKYLVNSEGTVIRQPVSLAVLHARAATRAPDGVRLKHFAPFHGHSVEDLPSEAVLEAAVRSPKARSQRRREPSSDPPGSPRT